MSTLANSTFPCFSAITVSILGVSMRHGLHHLKRRYQWFVYHVRSMIAVIVDIIFWEWLSDSSNCDILCVCNFSWSTFDRAYRERSFAYVAKKSTMTGTLEFLTRSLKSLRSCTLKVADTTCSCAGTVAYALLPRTFRIILTPVRCMSYNCLLLIIQVEISCY